MTEGAELEASWGGGLSMAPEWKGGSALRPGAGLDLMLELDEEDLGRRKLESVDEDDVEEIVDDGGLRLAEAPSRPGGARDWGCGAGRDCALL